MEDKPSVPPTQTLRRRTGFEYPDVGVSHVPFPHRIGDFDGLVVR